MTTEFTDGVFAFIAGIEDTCVYPPREFEMEPLDEYELTDHTRQWRGDLDLIRNLGGTAVRYGVNWPLVHVAENEFDWAWLDERLHYASNELGLTVIADLVHYGTPTWLAGSFADPRYADAVAQFAGEFAARYRGVVDHLTPLNEPLTTASFCGLRGVWPPALSGWTGWTTVVIAMVDGMAKSIAAIRAANPDAVIVHVEASSLYGTDDPELVAHAAELVALGMLPTDLLLGRVTTGHELHPWLLSNGANPGVLERLTADPPSIDLMGVNYYPDLSPRSLIASDGDVTQLAINRWTEGLEESLLHFSRRYGLPMLVTETSIEGSDAVRVRWLDDSLDAIDRLRDDGVDIRGYTWWPLLDFVDWSYASGGRNVEEFAVDEAVVSSRRTEAASHDGPAHAPRKTPFLRRMGLISLEERADGSLERIPTPVADRFLERARESRLEARLAARLAPTVDGANG